MSKFNVGDIIAQKGFRNATITGIREEDYFVVFGDCSQDWHSTEYIDRKWSLARKAETVENNAEMVAHPDHYGGDTTYEVIKVIEAWGLDNDAFLFNVIKYTARAGKKGKQLEDLKKAEFYLQRRIAILERLQEAK